MKAALVLALAGCASSSGAGRLEYPAARRDATVDTYHGTPVADPYRWLEDPDAPETRAWIEAENRVTQRFLAGATARGAFVERITALERYDKLEVPVVRGGVVFHERRSGTQNQPVLHAGDRVLLDPNTLSADGTTSLSSWTPSDDGKLLAYSLSYGGSDWQEWHVLDVETGAPRADVVKWSKWSSAAWLPDGSGFFYSAYDAPKEGTDLSGVNEYQKLFLHRVGTAQADDELVLERKDQKEWGFDAEVTEDGRKLIVTVWKGTAEKYGVLVGTPRAPWRFDELTMAFDAEYVFLTNDGDTLYFKTTKDAPRGKIAAVDLATKQWRDVVPQAEETIEKATVAGDVFFVRYLVHATSQVKSFGLDGKPGAEVEFDAAGSATGFDGRRADREVYYSFETFNRPATIYKVELFTMLPEVWRAPEVPFDPAAFEIRQVFYTSKDGTRVPMFLAHRRGLALTPETPVLLYGYGGFNIAITPWYEGAVVAWMERGGVFAVANIRGGGEYGQAWHEAGMRANKQNVFDDFIAAAEHLVAEKMTSPKKLAIWGGSNGGLLVGACIVQRPDLFGAALPDVAVTDMLRFHKFTIGWAWVDDYGSADVAADFPALFAYSPYHNVKPGASYPATLITTADHDDRVVPGHSFKLAAALQHAQGGDAPVLIRIDTMAGHGSGMALKKKIEKAADQLGFLVRVLAID